MQIDMINSFTGKKGKIKEKIALSEKFSVENKSFSVLSRHILYITQYVSIFTIIIYIYIKFKPKNRYFSLF